MASTLGCVALALLGCDSGSNSATQPQAEAVAVQAQKAVAGVGKKGQSLQGHTGVAKIISGPAATMLNFEQKAVLEIQIPHALQLYRATEGNWPKSHEEFMSKIVEANRLTLPELPDGAIYQFNTEKGELWVYPEDEVPAQN